MALAFAENVIAGRIGRIGMEEYMDSEREKFLEKIINAISHPVYVIDANDYRVIMANTAANFGKLDVNSVCHALTHNSDKPCSDKCACPLEEVKRTKKPVVVEHIHYNKSGEERNVEVHGDPILDKEGNVTQMIEYAIDITENRKKEERYKNIIKSSMDGFWIADTQGNFLDANDSYCKIAGYTSEELLKMNISDIEAIENRDDIQAHIRKIKEDGSDRFETRHRRKDGKMADVELCVNYMKSTNQLYIFARDVTGRKQSEDEIRKARRELEEKVRDLEKFNKITMDREKRVIELKDEVKRLKKELEKK